MRKDFNAKIRPIRNHLRCLDIVYTHDFLIAFRLDITDLTKGRMTLIYGVRSSVIVDDQIELVSGQTLKWIFESRPSF